MAYDVYDAQSDAAFLGARLHYAEAHAMAAAVKLATAQVAAQSAPPDQIRATLSLVHSYATHMASLGRLAALEDAQAHLRQRSKMSERDLDDEFELHNDEAEKRASLDVQRKICTRGSTEQPASPALVARWRSPATLVDDAHPAYASLHNTYLAFLKSRNAMNVAFSSGNEFDRKAAQKSYSLCSSEFEAKQRSFRVGLPDLSHRLSQAALDALVAIEAANRNLGFLPTNEGAAYATREYWKSDAVLDLAREDWNAATVYAFEQSELFEAIALEPG